MTSRDERLRVLMVTQRMRPYLAGAEIQALGLASALREYGVDARFVATRYAPRLAAREVVRGHPVSRVPVLRGPLLKPSQLVSTALWVLAHAREFDVVHAHCVSPASLGALAAARVARLPVVLKPSRGGADGEIARVRGNPAARPLLRLLPLLDAAAAMDDAIAAELLDAGVPRERIVRVHNGVDLDAFSPPTDHERARLRDEFGFPHGPIVLFAGQLIPRKGLVETLGAWRAVSRELADGLLVIAGDGPAREAAVAAAGDAAARVRYLGFVDDVSELMRASDVCVSPSADESFGNVVVEALASGLPVIAGRTGIAAQLPLDGVAGRFVDGPSTAAIASALRWVLGPGGGRAALGPRARAIAARFGFAGVAAQYEDVYRSIVAGRRVWAVSTAQRRT